MGQLRISALGAPEVRHEERVVKFRSRKVLALLLYLAIEGHTVTRQKVSALLWPDSDEAAARSTLRRTLADLRGALDESPVHTHLVVERGALAFAFLPGDELDVRVVDAALELQLPSDDPPTGASARQAALEQLQRADRLCRSPFLDGFSLDDAPDFEQWISEQRASWLRRANLICERLAALQYECGDVPGAIETVHHWLARDPLQEAAYRRLMLLHLSLANTREALAAYDNCCHVLATELHTRPLPETQVLAERIRLAASDGAARGRSGASHGVRAQIPETLLVAAESSSEPSSSPELILPLVGRSEQRLQMVDAFQAVRRGQSRVVIVTGEAGIGKTRLAQDFSGWARAHGADVLQARAFETGGRLPYQLLVESFRPRLEAENAPDDLLSDVWLAELTRLFPELRERYPDLPAVPESDGTAPARLYEALTRLGFALATKVPLVLLLDDVQWADTATLDALHYATRRWRQGNASILLLVNMRRETLAAASSLSLWVSDLERDTQAAHLQLDSLSFEETLRVLEALANKADQSEQIAVFGQWLFAETQGQPLYLAETLKALLERRLLIQVERDGSQRRIDFRTSAIHQTALRRFLPPGVRELIRLRLNQLTPEGFALLVACAVLGRVATFEHLCQIAGLDERAGLLAVDEVVRNRFLREEWAGETVGELTGIGTASGRYYFTHDKVRDVVYSEAGEARRRVFHRRALESMPAASPADRAEHALAAGLHAQACALFVAAGDQALKVFAVSDAIANYERAARLAPQLPESLSLDMVRQLYCQLGRAYELMSRGEDAERAYQELLTYAQQAPSTPLECIALSCLALMKIQFRMDAAQANALLRQALDKAQKTDDKSLLADMEWHLAQLGFYDFDAETIIEHAQRALVIARETGASDLIARCVNALSYGMKQRGQLGLALVYAQESMALFRQLGNRAMEVDCLCVLASIMLNQGRVEEGLQFAQTAYNASLAIGNAWGQVNSMYHLALGALERDACDEAREYAERCVGLCEEYKLSALGPGMYSLLGIAQRSLGLFDEARSTHQVALAMSEEMASPALIAAAAEELCADYVALGQWDDALANALRVVAGKSDLFVMGFGLNRWCVTASLTRGGEFQSARDDLEHWRARIQESPRHRMSYLRAVACLAHAEGQDTRATAALREALNMAQSLGLARERKEVEAML